MTAAQQPPHEAEDPRVRSVRARIALVGTLGAEAAQATAALRGLAEEHGLALPAETSQLVAAYVSLDLAVNRLVSLATTELHAIEAARDPAHLEQHVVESGEGARVVALLPPVPTPAARRHDLDLDLASREHPAPLGVGPALPRRRSTHPVVPALNENPTSGGDPR